MAAASYVSSTNTSSYPPLNLGALNKRLDRLISARDQQQEAQIGSFSQLGYSELQDNNPGLEKFVAVMMKKLPLFLPKCTSGEAEDFLSKVRNCYQYEPDVDERLKGLSALVRSPFAAAPVEPPVAPKKSYLSALSSAPKEAPQASDYKAAPAKKSEPQKTAEPESEMAYRPRIRRWFVARPGGSLDPKGGQLDPEVFRDCQHMTPAHIQNMIRQHAFSREVDHFCAPATSMITSNSKSTYYHIPAHFAYDDGTSSYGLVQYAINEQGVCYHRFFDPMSFSELRVTSAIKLAADKRDISFSEIGELRDDVLGINITILHADQRKG